MGRNDNRKSMKMRRISADKKKSARLKRHAEAKRAERKRG